MAAPATFSPLMESIDPATGMVIARLEATPPSEVPGILTQARRAQAGWAAQSLQERCALVHRLRETIYARRQEIAERVMRESGKPRVEALFADVLVSLDTAAYYANLAPALLLPEHVPHRSEEHTSELQSRGHLVCRLLLEKK